MDQVEQGQDLTNQEASQVYDLEVEPGAGGPFQKLVIGPHAQYRMDLRGITIPQVRAALKNFLKAYFNSKSQQGWEYDRWTRELERGEPVRWEDPRMALTVVFSSMGGGKIKLVTTFWLQYEATPKVHPGQCAINARYSPPVGDISGWKTLAPSDAAIPSSPTKDQALPSPPNSRSKPQGKPSFNGPPGSDEALDGKSLHKDRARTLGQEGEDSHPDPEPRTTPIRRQDMSASVEETAAIDGPNFPGAARQHKEYGEAKRYFRKYYRQNRSKVQQRMRRWYRKYKHRFKFKKDKERRREYPTRFKRMPGGYGTVSERAKDQRKENTKTAAWGMGAMPVLFLPGNQEAFLLSLDLTDGAEVAVLEFPEGLDVTLTLEEFFESTVFEDADDLEEVLELLDQEYGVESEDPLDEEEQLLDQRVIERLANFYIEKFSPDVPTDQKYNRGSERQPWMHEHEPLPGDEPGSREVTDNPGSAKVMPYNKDLVNNKAAVLISEIRGRCQPKLLSSASSIRPVLKRVDAGKLMWLFDVPGSKGASYRVRVKASGKANLQDVTKMDVKVSCSCPYWQWQGPEHWASTEGYLYGKPVGTASRPVVKDPDGGHRACKHVLAVFDKVEQFLISRRKKQGSLETAAATRVARRYLESVLVRS